MYDECMQEGFENMDEKNNSHARDAVLVEQFPSTGDEKRDKKVRLFFDAMVKTKGVVTMACVASGVSRSAVYEWQKQHDWFKEAVERYQIEYRGEWLENQLFKLCEEGDTQAVKFALQNKKLARFGYAERIEHDQQGGLSQEQIALLKRTGIEVADVESTASKHEGRSSNIALPYARKSGDIHGTIVH